MISSIFTFNLITWVSLAMIVLAVFIYGAYEVYVQRRGFSGDRRFEEGQASGGDVFGADD
ncbi:MAG: hypothetical protein AAF557_09555 [Pseudomonadota bacterium]